MASVDSWKALAAVFAGLTAAGAALDQLTLLSGKRRLYDALLAFWIRLDEMRVSDVSRAPAEILVRRLEPWRARPWRAVAATTVISLGLTAGAAVAGRVVRTAFYRHEFPPDATIVAVATTHAEWLFAKSNVYFRAFFVNWAFDFFTILVTAVLLGRYRSAPSMARALGWLSANLVVAYAFAVIGLAFSYASTGFTYYTGSAVQTLIIANRAVSTLLTWGFDNRSAYLMDDAFFACTTLVPIGLFLCVLFCLTMMKLLVQVVVGVGRYVAALAIEPTPSELREKFKPFTLFGIFFGLMSIAVKLAIDGWQLATGR